MRNVADQTISGARLDAIVQAMPLRAAGLIVTLYGDVVVPRGGEIWMGSIVETCALVGISETLVRTAVSRLVSAGQLEGWRRGRRSFYRLTDRAGADFAEAERLIYGPPQPWRWRFVHLPEAEAEARMVQLEQQGFARLRPHLAVGPARGPLMPGILAFDVDIAGDSSLLPDFAKSAWDLAPHARAYADLVALFAPLEPLDLGGAEAMAARLLLVHAWRQVLLRDPRLPPAALPVDWPGNTARALFHRLYGALSPASDSYVGSHLEGAEGLLPVATAATKARLASQKVQQPQRVCDGGGDRV